MTDRTQCIVIAVTESCPIPDLWHATLPYLRDSATGLLAVFMDDARWQRAASLPFTREIPRIGGASVDFTPRRADEVRRDAILRARQHLERLAAEAHRPLAFEVLGEEDDERILEIIGHMGHVVVASSLIVTMPVYAKLTRLDCRIILIDSPGQHQAER